MFCPKLVYVQSKKALIYCTFDKSHINSFILLVFQHVANFRYVANFAFLTLYKIRKESNEKTPVITTSVIFLLILIHLRGI